MPNPKFFLSIKDKINFLQLARYSGRAESSYRNLFSRRFDFFSFNQILIETYVKGAKALIFDPSYINKAGKHTAGVGYFWSGVAGKPKWGLELGGLGVLDIDRHTAFHLNAIQTIDVKDDETLLTFYSRKLLEHKEPLLNLSKYLLVDAFFSKETFVTPMCEQGFDIISRLRTDANLTYLYQGKQKGRGRPKQYDGKVDYANLSDKHATCVQADDKQKIYTFKAHSVALKKQIKVVIVYTLTKGNKHKGNKHKDKKSNDNQWQHHTYFSTDLTQDWQDILSLYKARFQIEFLYRDAKQHTGLNDCQARDKNKLDFHWNMSLTAINLAKVKYWLPQKDTLPNDTLPFSMSDVKTRYHNGFMVNQFISMFAINPKLKVNRDKIAGFLDFGRRVG